MCCLIRCWLSVVSGIEEWCYQCTSQALRIRLSVTSLMYSARCKFKNSAAKTHLSTFLVEDHSPFNLSLIDICRTLRTSSAAVQWCNRSLVRRSMQNLVKCLKTFSIKSSWPIFRLLVKNLADVLGNKRKELEERTNGESWTVRQTFTNFEKVNFKSPV